MRIIALCLVITFLGIGIPLMVINVRKTQPVFLGYESTFFEQVKISLLIGLSSCLIFNSVILVVGLLDRNYIFNARSVLGSFFVSGGAGMFVFFGSLVQFTTVKSLRNKILKRFGKKSD